MFLLVFLFLELYTISEIIYFPLVIYIYGAFVPIIFIYFIKYAQFPTVTFLHFALLALFFSFFDIQSKFIRFFNH